MFIDAMSALFEAQHLYQHLGLCLIMWVVIFCVVLLDLADAVHTAKVTGEKIHSHGLRLTVIKFGEYWRFLLFGFLFDLLGVIFPWYGYPYMTIVITIGLAVIEFKSLLEHAKKRKSKTAELPNIIKDIVECATTEDAQKLVKSIRDIYDETKK